MNDTLIAQIDALLPQTQCGQCGYNGCLPYATAMAAENEAINRCPPGGVKTLYALANLLGKNVEPYAAEMPAQQQSLQAAYIQEGNCIGCTKCIQACPIDAIIGAAKQLHVVLTEECTGCGLCVEPCPVDCIELKNVSVLAYSPQKARERFYAKKTRILPKIVEGKAKINDKKAYIEAALARARAKRRNEYT
jgi:electron transport complex protein RnfB